MADLFDTTILCDRCSQKTLKKTTQREGFPFRSWVCPSCKQVWNHPQDEQEYENFRRLKQKQFQVKLRIVGNSYTVSIPREIIEFEEEMRKEVRQEMEEMEEMDSIINMWLEEPDKLSLFFGKRARKIL